MITLDDLKAICKGTSTGRLAVFVEPLNDAMHEFEIDANVQRETHFLAQIAHESGGFTYTHELWGPTPQQEQYEPPSAKATDLGNTEPGDGLRFKGRGLIQITGRDNYRACGAALGVSLLDQPELLESPDLACRSACWFWKTHGLNELADAGDARTITKRINGGLNGYQDRLSYLELAQQRLA